MCRCRSDDLCDDDPRGERVEGRRARVLLRPWGHGRGGFAMYFVGFVPAEVGAVTSSQQENIECTTFHAWVVR